MQPIVITEEHEILRNRQLKCKRERVIFCVWVVIVREREHESVRHNLNVCMKGAKMCELDIVRKRIGVGVREKECLHKALREK